MAAFFQERRVALQSSHLDFSLHGFLSHEMFANARVEAATGNAGINVFRRHNYANLSTRDVRLSSGRCEYEA